MLIIVLSILATISLIISIFSFLQKGPLISLIYYMSNQSERKELKIKKRYYFIGTIFLTSAILFSILLADEIFHLPSIQTPLIIISIILCVYYIVRYTQLEVERIKKKINKK
ncbi:DUF3784 domain-containing protein [Alkaliphilus serpentinus]|uniref:DUF3784 domain-containing protein n=1 Tax=Alkaliphilus serpentinus TaxID=1482731 RepID=A0A833HNG1_9FIRM|nr:DUF3784 domain-containing protein [Alkaliphilus serpentinus]KAB3529603.1 DUF3784 domain-containing protein [Alkaliphilus serpentinus]